MVSLAFMSYMYISKTFLVLHSYAGKFEFQLVEISEDRFCSDEAMTGS